METQHAPAFARWTTRQSGQQHDQSRRFILSSRSELYRKSIDFAGDEESPSTRGIPSHSPQASSHRVPFLPHQGLPQCLVTVPRCHRSSREGAKHSSVYWSFPLFFESSASKTHLTFYSPSIFLLPSTYAIVNSNTTRSTHPEFQQPPPQSVSTPFASHLWILTLTLSRQARSIK